MSDREHQPPANGVDGTLDGEAPIELDNLAVPPAAREAMAALAEARRRDVPDEVKRRLRERLAAETGALSPTRPTGPTPAQSGSPSQSAAGDAPRALPERSPWRRTLPAVLAAFIGGVIVGGLAVRGLEPPRLVAVVPGEGRGSPPAPSARAVAYEEQPAPADPAPANGVPPVPVVADPGRAANPTPPVAATASTPATAPAAAPSPSPDSRPAASRPGSARTGGSRDTDLAAERALLEIARTAIARRDSRTALDALGQHGREFSHGRLEEERDSLWVQALVQAARLPEARERATRFRRRYPDSLLLPAVESAVSTVGHK